MSPITPTEIFKRRRRISLAGVVLLVGYLGAYSALDHTTLSLEERQGKKGETRLKVARIYNLRHYPVT